jgi:hypothetical protein
MPRRGTISYSSLSRSTIPPGLPLILESPKQPKEKDGDNIVEVMKVCRGEGMLDAQLAKKIQDASFACRTRFALGQQTCARGYSLYVINK